MAKDRPDKVRKQKAGAGRAKPLAPGAQVATAPLEQVSLAICRNEGERERLRKEARAAIGLVHGNVVRVQDVKSHAGVALCGVPFAVAEERSILVS